MNDLLHLLQLADSSFPTGAFAHSWGLETLVQEGWLGAGFQQGPVEPEAALYGYLRARIDLGLARQELPLLLAAHVAARAGVVEELRYLDALAAAAQLVREWREAGGRMGRRLLTAVAGFAPAPLVDDLLRAAPDREQGPQLPVAFGVAAAVLGCSGDNAALAYAYSTVNGSLAAAVRLGVVGQRGVQSLLHRLKPALFDALQSGRRHDVDIIGLSLPLAEIAGMRHEHAEARLFAS